MHARDTTYAFPGPAAGYGQVNFPGNIHPLAARTRGNADVAVLGHSKYDLMIKWKWFDVNTNQEWLD
jgi:hypothetical protein